MTRREDEARGEAEDVVSDVLIALGFQPVTGGHDRAVAAVTDRLARLRQKWIARLMQAQARHYDDD
jgi:hypothetical protein